MKNVVIVNGSPQKEKGNTAALLAPFSRGMESAGAHVETLYSSDLEIRSCTGEMYCWYEKPGQCYIKDQMQDVYPKLRAAEVLVLATPVYIPLPGKFQDLLNRLCPLVAPILEMRDGRTRARFREEVSTEIIALVATGGWWEEGNFDVVVHIARELAENANVAFGGALLRPHAFAVRRDGKPTEEGRKVQEAAETAGRELIEKGIMSQPTLEAVKRPLLEFESLIRRYNRAYEQACRKASNR